MLRVEQPRREDRPDQRRHVVVTFAERLAQRLEQPVGRWRLADEERVELADEEPGAGRLLQDDPHDVGAVPVAGPAEERLGAVVVQLGLEPELLAAGVPAGEGAGRLADVLLGVAAADAQGEQLHQLAGVVLVSLALDVAVGVEPDEHGGVLAHRLQERLELAQGLLAQRQVLLEHQAGADDLVDAGGEVVVPEQGELLAERVQAVQHGVQPPAAQRHGVVLVGDQLAGGDEELQALVGLGVAL